jgi:hypothetical protein
MLDNSHHARRVDLERYTSSSCSQQTCSISARVAADQNLEIPQVEEGTAEKSVLQLLIIVCGVEGSLSVVDSCLDSRCLRRKGSIEVDACLRPVPL